LPILGNLDVGRNSMWALIFEEDDQLSVASQYNATYIMYLAPSHQTRPQTAAGGRIE